MKKLWIIVICVIVFGGVFMTVGGALGAKRGMYIDNTGIHTFGGGNGNRVTVADDMDIAPYQNISVAVYSMDIEVIPSDTFGIHIEGRKNQNLTWSDEGGTLTVTENGGGWSIFNIDLNSFFDWFTGSAVKLYIPAGTNFENVDIKTTSGNMNIPSLNGQSVQLHDTSGDIRLGSVTANSLTAGLTSGGITADSVTADTCDIGVVSGDINVKEINASRLTAGAVSGGVTLSGSIRDQIDAHAVSGDIRLTLAGKAADYVKTLHTVSGDIRVDNTRMGSVSESGTGSTLKAHTTSGNIRVAFGG